jgi:DNA-binding transcriptional ArsR family regulator
MTKRFSSEELSGMKKNELQQVIEELYIQMEEDEKILLETVAEADEMEETLTCLEERLCVAKKTVEGRKEQVLKILKEGPIMVGAIAKRLGISARNVSSQLSYLRKDGYEIATSSTGKKMLV